MGQEYEVQQQEVEGGTGHRGGVVSWFVLEEMERGGADGGVDGMKFCLLGQILYLLRSDQSI